MPTSRKRPVTLFGLRILTGQLLRPVMRHAAQIFDPPRVITGRDGDDEYLSRWYVKGRPKESEAFDDKGNPKLEVEMPKDIGVYVHRFHRSDADSALHNHPWAWAVSLVLSGGYSEERRTKTGGVERRNVFPLSINVIRHDTFHRVDLFEEDAWSIFIAGPRVSSWSFWDRDTKEETPWREFLAREAAK
jgi:hypothetical protein